jgi:hypothetical protein
MCTALPKTLCRGDPDAVLDILVAYILPKIDAIHLQML